LPKPAKGAAIRLSFFHTAGLASKDVRGIPVVRQSGHSANPAAPKARTSSPVSCGPSNCQRLSQTSSVGQTVSLTA